jgi:hypothetical protein
MHFQVLYFLYRTSFGFAASLHPHLRLPPARWNRATIFRGPRLILFFFQSRSLKYGSRDSQSVTVNPAGKKCRCGAEIFAV